VRRKLSLSEVGAGATPTATAGAGSADTSGTQTESQLEPVTSAGIILPETGQFLLLQQLQRWRQTRGRVLLFFLYILLPFCRNSLPRTTCFLGSEQLQASARVKKLAADADRPVRRL